MKIPTLFVPMMFGIPVLFCGVVGLNPHRRKASVNVTGVIMTVGLVIGLVQTVYGLMIFDDRPVVESYAIRIMSAMTIICAAYCLICVGTWIWKVRSDKAAQRQPESTVHSGQYHPTDNTDSVIAAVSLVPIDDEIDQDESTQGEAIQNRFVTRKDPNAIRTNPGIAPELAADRLSRPSNS